MSYDVGNAIADHHDPDDTTTSSAHEAIKKCRAFDAEIQQPVIAASWGIPKLWCFTALDKWHSVTIHKCDELFV